MFLTNNLSFNQTTYKELIRSMKMSIGEVPTDEEINNMYDTIKNTTEPIDVKFNLALNFMNTYTYVTTNTFSKVRENWKTTLFLATFALVGAVAFKFSK